MENVIFNLVNSFWDHFLFTIKCQKIMSKVMNYIGESFLGFYTQGDWFFRVFMITYFPDKYVNEMRI